MKAKSMKQIWLNWILHLSSYVYRQKNKLFNLGVFGTIFQGLYIVVLEIFLSILSLPFYLFLTPEENDPNFKGNVKAYRLRQKITLAAIILFILIQAFKALFAVTGIVIFPFAGEAKTLQWNFDSPSEYRGDYDYIKIRDGYAIFTPKNKDLRTSDESDGDDHYGSGNEGQDEGKDEDRPNKGVDEKEKGPEESSFMVPLQAALLAANDTSEAAKSNAQSEKTDNSAKPNENKEINNDPAEEEKSQDSDKEEDESDAEEENDDGVKDEDSESVDQENDEDEKDNADENSNENQDKDNNGKVKDKEFCQATLMPKKAIEIFDVSEWTGFEEIASKNGGEIYYQLSFDDGNQWLYYNGNNWASTEDQYNTAEEINKFIAQLQIKEAQVLFKAKFVNECEGLIELDALGLSYKQGKTSGTYNLSSSNADVYFTNAEGEQIDATENSFYLTYKKAPVAYFSVTDDFNSDSYIVGTTDEKSWVHFGSSDRSAIDKIVLFIPKKPRQTYVVVCPGATSADNIHLGCSRAAHLSKNMPTMNGYTLINQDDPDFWQVTASPDDFSTGGQGQESGPLEVHTGYYVGTGAARSITGLGFNPSAVIIKADTAAGAAVMKTSQMPSPNTAFFTATADNTSSEITLGVDGFSVGTNNAVNAANVRYTYIAFAGSDCSVDGEFCAGYYIGDGLSSTKITTGFQPDLIWVKRSGSSANWHSSSMPINVGQFFDATTQNATGTLFTSIDTDGFNVGVTNNANLGVYYYVAFKASPGKVNVGSFTGNGTDNRNITGVGFEPDMVYLKNAGLAVSGVYDTNYTYGDYSSLFTAAANATNNIQSLQSDGFQIGSSSNVNANGNAIYWAAFGQTSEPNTSGSYEMATGSFVGTGSAFSVSGLGFAPDLVIIKHHDQVTDQHAVFRTRMMAGNTTSYLANAATTFSGGITSLDNDGFTLGTNAAVNTLADTYYWTAFGNAWDPDTHSGASDFVIGAYTGNGLDDRSISELPFAPDLVTIKRVGASVGVWRTSNIVGDFSTFFSGLAGAANFIQSLGSDAFQIGTANEVNAAGSLYHWFAFKAGLNFVVDDYIGTGSTQNITSVNFEPELLWVKSSTTTNNAIARTIAQAGNAAQPFVNQPTLSNAITALIPNGFTVGTAAETNTNSVNYRYAAWRMPDTVSPTGSLTYSDSDALVKSGDSLTITATFSEPLADNPAMNITITGANSVGPVPMTKIDSQTYQYIHNVGGGDGMANVTFSVGTDTSGNLITATPTGGGSFTVDNTPPSHQNSVFPSSLAVNSGGVININSSGDPDNQVWLAPLNTTNFIAGPTMTQATDGVSITILAPNVEGEYRLFIIDKAGNISLASTAILTVDDTSPQISISSSQTSPTKTPVLNFTVTFDEDVFNFTDADVLVTNGVVSNFSGSGSVYYFDVTPPSLSLSTVTVDIPGGVALDQASNPNDPAVPFIIVANLVPDPPSGGGGAGGGGSAGGSGGGGGGMAPKAQVKNTPEATTDLTQKVNFSDIGQHWSKNYVTQLVEICGVEGYQDPLDESSRIFKPDAKISRAELVAMILKCRNETIEKPKTRPFPDVSLSQWHAGHVKRAKDLGIVNGFKDGSFKPDDSASRAEALKIISLSNLSMDRINQSFGALNCSDTSESAWYLNYFKFAFANKIIVGYKGSEGTIECRPDQDITRAEAAKLILEMRKISLNNAN